MSCLITDSYSIGCRQMAGIQSVAIGLWNGTTLTYTYAADGLTIATFSGGTNSFYNFNQPIETASYTAPMEINNENNTIAYRQTLSITLTGLTAALINKIKLLGQGVWRVIILDKNGNYYLMGRQGPVQVSGGETGLGKANGDLNGASLTFTSLESETLTALSASAAASVITY